VRAFVTGGTGFVGSRLVRRIVERGDDVVALVRSPASANLPGAALVEGDLSDRDRLARGLAGCDAAFHLAADYRLGIRRSERAGMWDTNVTGTENVLDAAIDEGVGRIVYVSTVNAFGNTRGRVVDEGYERPPNDYISAYDETKHLAHRAAEARIAAGAPILIAQPGVVYGPGDHSVVGGQVARAAAGKLSYGDLHALDLATGEERAGWPLQLIQRYEYEYVWAGLQLIGGRLYLPVASYCDETAPDGFSADGRLVAVDPSAIDRPPPSTPSRATAISAGSGGGAASRPTRTTP
jgi:NAD(P)-dependent dehydrogenase (short-subunit alcohol dehydrogenase family)